MESGADEVVQTHVRAMHEHRHCDATMRTVLNPNRGSGGVMRWSWLGADIASADYGRRRACG
jgi:hypothetical protein